MSKELHEVKQSFQFLKMIVFLIHDEMNLSMSFIYQLSDSSTVDSQQYMMFDDDVNVRSALQSHYHATDRAQEDQLECSWE